MTSASMNWKQIKCDRGLSWICFQGESVVGGISFSYLPSSSGEAFARNRGKGHVSIIVRNDDEVLKECSFSASSRTEADRLVRKTIREEGLRSLVERR